MLSVMAKRTYFFVQLGKVVSFELVDNKLITGKLKS
jgi:hypothetical protein